MTVTCDNLVQVILVTGGWGKSSTELLQGGSWTTVSSASQDAFRYGFVAVTLDNVIYFFGKRFVIVITFHIAIRRIYVPSMDVQQNISDDGER